jgi:hypothetical protein
MLATPFALGEGMGLEGMGYILSLAFEELA